MSKIGIYGLIIGIFIAYFLFSQYTIKQLNIKSTELNTQIELLTNTLYENEKAIRIQKQAIEAYMSETQTSRARADEALRILEEHDLEALTTARPKLLEDKVNKATKNTFKEIEDATKP